MLAPVVLNVDNKFAMPPQLACMFLLIILASRLDVPESKRFHSIGGPFRIVIRHLEHCPREMQAKEKMEFFYRDVRRRHTEDHRYTGNLTMPFYMNNTMGGAITVASWSNMGGWKTNAHIIRAKPICRNLELMLSSLWHPYLRSVYGELVPCYFYPGTYRFQNMTVSMHSLPVKHFLYGRWRADAQMEYANGDIAACVRAFADTVPV